LTRFSLKTLRPSFGFKTLSRLTVSALMLFGLAGVGYGQSYNIVLPKYMIETAPERLMLGAFSLQVELRLRSNISMTMDYKWLETDSLPKESIRQDFTFDAGFNWYPLITESYALFAGGSLGYRHSESVFSIPRNLFSYLPQDIDPDSETFEQTHSCFKINPRAGIRTWLAKSATASINLTLPTCLVESQTMRAQTPDSSVPLPESSRLAFAPFQVNLQIGLSLN
jgi:hypothetical protein